MKPQGPRVLSASLSKPSKPNFRRTFLRFAILVALIAPGAVPVARANGQLVLTPNAVNFGRVPVGRTHALSVMIANTGNTTVKLSGDAVTGGGFGVSGISMPFSLSAGATATLEVRFTPQNVGGSSGTLKLISDAANGTVAVALTGSGYARSAGYVTATPLTARFGDVPLGTKNTQSVQIKNTGWRGVSISSVSATGTGFSVLGITTPYWLRAGATAELTIGFQPASAGNADGAVTIGSTASDSSVSIAVSGTGMATTRLLSVSPGSIAFGNVNVGASTTHALTLSNTGNSSLTISGDTSSGAGISATGIMGSTTLTPGQSATLTASFAPKAAGSVTGSITITSNATNGSSLGVPVTGIGVSTVNHSVALTWQPSSSSVSGYYVYRATTSGGPYARIDSSPVSGASYTDSAVSSGATYYYAVTALGTDGIESGYSNQVTAAVP